MHTIVARGDTFNVHRIRCKPGDRVRVLTEDREGTEWIEVTHNSIDWNRVVRITTFDGVMLTLSINTWLTCRDGHLVMAANAHMVRVPVIDEDGRLDWRACTVEALEGDYDVAHIKCHSRTYAAADEPGSMILTHNIDKP